LAPCSFQSLRTELSTYALQGSQEEIVKVFEKAHFLYSEYARKVLSRIELASEKPFASFLLLHEFSWSTEQSSYCNYLRLETLFFQFVLKITEMSSLQENEKKELLACSLMDVDACALRLTTKNQKKTLLLSTHADHLQHCLKSSLEELGQKDYKAVVSTLKEGFFNDISIPKDLQGDAGQAYYSALGELEKELSLEDFEDAIGFFLFNNRACSFDFHGGSNFPVHKRLSKSYVLIKNMRVLYEGLPSGPMKSFLAQAPLFQKKGVVSPLQEEERRLQTSLDLVLTGIERKRSIIFSIQELIQQHKEFSLAPVLQLQKKIQTFVKNSPSVIACYLRNIGWQWDAGTSIHENYYQYKKSIFTLFFFLFGKNVPQKVILACQTMDLSSLTQIVYKKLYRSHKADIQQKRGNDIQWMRDLEIEVSKQEKSPEVRVLRMISLLKTFPIDSYEARQALDRLEGTMIVRDYQEHVEGCIATVRDLSCQKSVLSHITNLDPKASPFTKYLALQATLQSLYHRMQVMSTTTMLMADEIFSRMDFTGIEWLIHREFLQALKEGASLGTIELPEPLQHDLYNESLSPQEKFFRIVRELSQKTKENLLNLR